ncbi:MAG: Dabb family protein [Planctomycetota bacterium]|jgi:hypothetical protein
MVEHVVLFAVTPGTASEKVDAMLASVRDLSSVPGVISISIGPTFTDRGRQYTHGLVVRLESREALQAYATHADHVAVVENRIKPIVDDLLALDWDV